MSTRVGGIGNLRRVANEYLGAGGRLDGRPGARAGALRLRARGGARAAAGARPLPGRPGPRGGAGRGRRRRRRRRARPARRPARARRDPARATSPGDPELGDAFNSREAELKDPGRRRRGGVAERRPPPPRGVPGGPAPGGARRGPRPARRAARPGRTRSPTSPSATPATSRPTTRTSSPPSRPRSATCCWRTRRPALRDAERLRRVHGWLDLSVAGVGGSAGSRWPLSRERLAELLGCDGLMVHAKDAMWQCDGYVELASAAATAATHGSQLGQDLEILASQEFAAVRLADRHSRASALMPQKRNPYALAVVRTQAGIAAGELAGDARDAAHRLRAHRPLPPAQRQRPAAARRVRRGGAPRWRRWSRAWRSSRSAGRGRPGRASPPPPTSPTCSPSRRGSTTAPRTTWSGARSATWSTPAWRPDALTPERIAAAAEASIGRPVAIAADALAAALDPAACAAARLQTGSSAPGEVAAMIAAVPRGGRRGRGRSARRRGSGRTGPTAALLARARELAGG